MKYVGFCPRFAALLVDIILSLVFFIPLWVLSSYLIIAHIQPSYLFILHNLPSRYIEYGINGIAYCVFSFLTELLFWYNYQGTLGYMMISARIVDSRTGRPPFVWQYIFRYVGSIISWLVFGLGFLRISCDDKKRGWHDLLAGTVVIQYHNDDEDNDDDDDSESENDSSDSESLDNMRQFNEFYSFEDPSRAHEIWMELPANEKELIARVNPVAADVMKQADKQLKLMQLELDEY